MVLEGEGALRLLCCVDGVLGASRCVTKARALSHGLRRVGEDPWGASGGAEAAGPASLRAERW